MFNKILITLAIISFSVLMISFVIETSDLNKPIVSWSYGATIASLALYFIRLLWTNKI